MNPPAKASPAPIVSTTSTGSHGHGQSLVVRSEHRDVRSPRREQHDARPAGQQAAGGVDRRLARRQVGEVVVADLHHIGSREHGVDAAEVHVAIADHVGTAVQVDHHHHVVAGRLDQPGHRVGHRLQNQSEPAREQRRGRGRKRSPAAAPEPMSPPCRSGRWLRREHRARPRRASSERSPAAGAPSTRGRRRAGRRSAVPKRSSDTAPMNPTVAPSRPHVRAVLNGAPPSAALTVPSSPITRSTSASPATTITVVIVPGHHPSGTDRAGNQADWQRRDQHRLTQEVVSDRHDRAGPARRI